MLFDPENPVVKLCSEGMLCEGEGNMSGAAESFNNAWQIATTYFEKFTAAHYVARHQKSIEDKLKWDELALHYALLVNSPDVKQSLPSLYLNIGKCHEDSNDLENAEKNYRLGLYFSEILSDIPYSKMIRGGLISGMDRIEKYLKKHQ